MAAERGGRQGRRAQRPPPPAQLSEAPNNCFLFQSLVQSRKAGITSAMATRTSLKDEELVRPDSSWARPGGGGIL